MDFKNKKAYNAGITNKGDIYREKSFACCNKRLFEEEDSQLQNDK